MAIRRERVRHPFDDLNTAFGEGGNLLRIIGQQPYFGNSQLLEDFRRRLIDSFIRVEAQLFVGIHRVQPIVLQFVGPQFVDQADAPAFLGKVEQDAGTDTGDFGDGAAQLVTAVSTQRAQQIAGETF